MSENNEYKLIEGGTDCYIERVKDGKRVADVTADGIKPSAPAYYKIMDKLEKLVDGDSPAEEPAKVEASSDTPPAMDAILGDRTPEFVVWLSEKDPEEAKSRYEGKGIPAYDNLTK